MIEQFGEHSVEYDEQKVIAQGPFYQCDPDKNKLCKRKICYKNENRADAMAECHLTKNPDFALDSDRQPYYVLHLKDAKEVRFVEVPRDQLFKGGVI